jgi:hypothetical protein
MDKGSGMDRDSGIHREPRDQQGKEKVYCCTGQQREGGWNAGREGEWKVCMACRGRADGMQAGTWMTCLQAGGLCGFTWCLVVST